MSFYLISDLHTELLTETELDNLLNKLKEQNTDVEKDILLLAGDIGNPRTQIYELFLRKISKIFKEKKIILIAGNHEYYDLKSKNCYDGDWIEDNEIHIREIISHFPNIIFRFGFFQIW